MNPSMKDTETTPSRSPKLAFGEEVVVGSFMDDLPDIKESEVMFSPNFFKFPGRR